MASVKKSVRSAAKARHGRSRSAALGALLTCSVIAASVWGLALTLSAMHEADHALAERKLDLKVALADIPRSQPVPLAFKSSRYLRVPESEVRARQLSAEAIQVAHQRNVAVQLALAESRRKAEEATILASAAPARISAEPDDKAGDKPAMVTALVEDVPARDLEPFDLVLSQPEADEEIALPSEVPLPEARPAIDPIVTGQKPVQEKPAERKNPDSKPAIAYAKPERSLLGSLFGRSSNEVSWPGSATKVAIYDVSNATVYLPDGTKLRAHSGIGPMRDNPRYDYVSMKGPTPAGIYRLSMREKRFYGVEAIRMTSVDGRDPKNRTGLLTHTNLLRGRIGSHGCVAFQNYQPFLNAFKRGQVNTLVVVPELPSSHTQLAELYRKAGA